MIVFERVTSAAPLAFDPLDAFEMDRGVRGSRPRPSTPLSITVTDVPIGAPGSPNAPFVLVTTKGPSGYEVFHGDVELSGRRGARHVSLPAGVYGLLIEAEHYVPLVSSATVPPPPPPLVPTPDSIPLFLCPGPSYPFPRENAKGSDFGPTLLRGRVMDVAGNGVEGIPVQLETPDPTGPICLRDPISTNEAGEWVLPLPDTMFIEQPIPIEPIAPLNVVVHVGTAGAIAIIPVAVTLGVETTGLHAVML